MYTRVEAERHALKLHKPNSPTPLIFNNTALECQLIQRTNTIMSQTCIQATILRAENTEIKT